MSVDPSFFGLQGFAFPVVESGGGSCDYPSEDDVRAGVTFDVFTGNLALPAEADVELGVQYGAEGTEFTGGLFIPTPEPTLPATGLTLRERGQRLFKKNMRRTATRSQTTVVYTRGATEIDVTGKAWVGRTVFSRRDKDHGPSVVFGERDYIVAVDALPFEPARGDRITETPDGGDPVVFEVLALPGEPECRYLDPSRTHWRVHVKEVS